ncbi:MAG: Eco57I restriction-modification methylase domain-containing protein, partial [Pseudanabaena sp.]
MSGNQLQPREALNKAYLKVKPDGERIGEFKANLVGLIDLINETKSEEFHKNLIIEFLKKTYYGDRYFINTKENSDLVIHNQKGVESKVGVIFETKKPTKTNNAEMPKVDNLNAKAFQQLVLYFLRERVTYKNLDIRYLVVTNVYEWFIFDATIFEQLFFNDKALVSQFTDFVEKRLSGKKTDFFYKQIAEPAIKAVIDQIKFTHFDIRDYEKFLRNTDGQDDRELINLYKLLSPEHLLKLPFTNDSNSLNKPFYNELLYIIGLAETKDGGKKLIGRVKDCDRNMGSLIENAMNELDSSDKISQLKKPEEFGVADDERLFNVALRLAITWINRVLFLKLLEAQLLKYHGDDQDFAFLNLTKIKSYGDLNRLFFSVLAREQGDRVASVKETFANVPYLNSSLFEPTDIEQQTISINNLASENLPIFGATVLADSNGKRRSGELNALEYLFEFLGAYRFNKDELESGEEDSEKLINSAVLGLIFEKINGYKDGSFYTPSFITMYMCRETIRRAVVQKFNEVKGWNCQGLDDLYERIEDKKEANTIINSLKICDPAVGSGHFLVSALNEMIAIKSELRILLDRTGKSLKDYRVEVRNDKLLVYDDEGKLFAYNPNNAEKQRVQEALFHEKQSIIESCLFGVDINPNSVKICQLRLWIELLKNAYYRVDPPQASLGVDPPQPPLVRGEKSRLKAGENINASFPPFTRGGRGDLETLPNIDINIKCGNSLISRFGLDVDVKQVLKKHNFTIEQYRNAVQTYRSAESKAQKREMEGLIAKIKAGFSSSLLAGDPKKVKLRQLQAELYSVENQMLLLEETKAEVKAREKRVNKLNNEIDKLSAEIEDIESGRLYENALEWRFEFPEVLNDDGDFVGFDIVIGNPPYGINFSIQEKEFLKEYYAKIHVRTPESFNYFSYRSQELGGKQSLCSLIIPSSFLNQIEFDKSRELILNNYSLILDVNLGDGVFEDVTTPTCIISFSKNISNRLILYADLSKLERNNLAVELNIINTFILQSSLISNQSHSFIFKDCQELIQKCYVKNPTLRDIAEEVATGISSGLDKAYVFSFDTIIEKKLEQTLLKKLVVGGEINSFYLDLKSGKQIIYITDENDIKDFPNINNELLIHKDQLIKRREAANGKIKWYSLNWPRRKKLFVEPKILIRQTANRIIAAYDEDQWYCLKSGIIVQLPNKSEVQYLYLLALLNSKLMNFLYSDLVNEDVRIFPEVKPIQLFKLPIVVPQRQIQIVLENTVNKIITAKKGDLHADTSELEKAINRLVYKLYQLTY